MNHSLYSLWKILIQKEESSIVDVGKMIMSSPLCSAMRLKMETFGMDSSLPYQETYLGINLDHLYVIGLLRVSSRS
jgi:hypothetical protein